MFLDSEAFAHEIAMKYISATYFNSPIASEDLNNVLDDAFDGYFKAYNHILFRYNGGKEVKNAINQAKGNSENK